jgi:hypothetical protein
VPGLLRLWPGVRALSWIVAFPLLLVVLPIVRAVTDRLVERA